MAVLLKSPSERKSGMLTPSDHATDIRLGEIIALEQERLARRAGQRVGENIAEIEAGGVTSLAEASVSPSRLGHMLRIDVDHDDLGLRDNCFGNHLVLHTYFFTLVFGPAGQAVRCSCCIFVFWMDRLVGRPRPMW